MEKNNDSKTFDSMIMLRYGKTKVAKKEFYGAKKKKKEKKIGMLMLIIVSIWLGI